MSPVLEMNAVVPEHGTVVSPRTVVISGLCIALAVVAAVVAQVLIHLIALVTNISFYGRFSWEYAAPTIEHVGAWVIVIPVLGAIVVGFMARYGSKAIRGHGIPEAMEQVLLNESRIPARLTFLKPVSSAIAIGTGGPFGAEGPIIATGGALGSLIGQLINTTAAERKTLLAAGAAAGMAATFGSPVSAVLLAIELLLFEFRPRSFVPVALAASTAAGMRFVFGDAFPVFPMPNLTAPSGGALAMYIVIGAIMGFVAVAVTRMVYAIEDAFEELPIHWMWWPAIGAVAVGIVGYFFPRTLGVGYFNITDILSGGLTLKFILVLALMKFISWSISLGSGTSGGTLAPLFTIGAGCGFGLGALAYHLAPHSGIDPRVAALVGMAAIFSGASRALLASAVFAFEVTLQPLGLLPLLAGCTASFLISCLFMKHTIMTEKIARRGVHVPSEYAADFLDTINVRDAAARNVVTFNANDSIEKARAFITSRAAGASHQGYPLVDDQGHLAGIVTRRNILDQEVSASQTLTSLMKRPPIICYEDSTLRQAMDHMVNHDVGRLPVLSRKTNQLVGIITRSDLLKAHRRRLDENRIFNGSQPRAPRPVLAASH